MGPCTAGEVNQGSNTRITLRRCGKQSNQVLRGAVKYGCQSGPGPAGAHISHVVSRHSRGARAWIDRSRGRRARKLLLATLRHFIPCLLLGFLSGTPILKSRARILLFWIPASVATALGFTVWAWIVHVTWLMQPLNPPNVAMWGFWERP